MKLLFLRHGKTMSNEERRYLGRTDEELSENGIDELRSKWNSPPKADLFAISPMKRCGMTVKCIRGEEFSDTEQIIIDEWREIDFGIFEGKTYEELKYNHDYCRWLDSNCEMKIPDGESRDEFVKRSMTGFYRLLSICKQKEAENVVCVVHGGTIMSIFSEISGHDYYDFMIENGESRELIIEEDRYEIPYYSISGRFPS
ncbi:MAG: histidine phosphatase family protein [Lachnospiraceae bacterium]|nr:histidine phosphatase family protein [Lachnospiraceae bacterium]